MKTRLFTGLVAAGMLLMPLSAADQAKGRADTTQQDPDMQRAIAFERYKDMAAARQAQLEAKHPTVFYNDADRQANRDEDASQGKKVIPENPKKDK